MRGMVVAAMSSCAMLAGCQGHLPPLETSPGHSGPKITDVTNNIECELASIVNYQTAPFKNDRLSSRIAADQTGDIQKLLPRLAAQHFVATAQLTLEVTDNEGFNPSLSFLNHTGSLTGILGGQLTGTEDRSITLNYSIDLNSLVANPTKTAQRIYDQYCGTHGNGVAANGLSGGIAGDLGLADIVSDGLLALNNSADTNLYASSGPVPQPNAQALALQGDFAIYDKSNPDTRVKDLTLSATTGTILFAPQAAGVQTQGAVTLAGNISLKDKSGLISNYIANWTGTLLPPDGNTYYFTLSGPLLPAPDTNFTKATHDWGASPTVSLTGKVDFNGSQFDMNTLNLTGSLSSSTNTSLGPVIITLNQPAGIVHAAAGSSSPAAKGGSSSSSAGGTSFGSVVDFAVVYGLNGGPNWTFKTFKGPAAGSSSLLTLSRTMSDSLSITFVAACQDYKQVSVVPTNYWSSIGPCDALGAAQQQSQAVGYENNSLMILRNLLGPSVASRAGL